MNENTSRGFDWSQFNFSFGAEPDTGTGTTPGTGLPGTGVPGTGTGTGSNTPKGSLFSFGNDALRIFNPAAKILGSTRPLDITGAINFLSQYGNTADDHNANLPPISEQSREGNDCDN